MTKIVGILNITPDSFSDGGKYMNHDDAINYANSLIEDGANIIDIGAESTRPNGTSITATQEQVRLENILPEISKIAREHNVKISLDSRHKDTILKFIDYIDIINDVSGLDDMAIVEIASRSQKYVIAMHSLTIPVDPNVNMLNDNPIEEIYNWAEDKINFLTSNNIHNIIIDPGIGFGKKPIQSWNIINNISKLKKLFYPILIGHSRKRFLKTKLSTSDKNNLYKLDNITSQISMKLVKNGIDYLRVHNVSINNKAIKKALISNKIK